MIRKILPIILACIGIAGGIGAGMALKPDPAEMAEIHPCGDVKTDTEHAKTGHDDEHDTPSIEPEFIKLTNQFVVPVVGDDAIASLVVMSLSLELGPGQSEAVYQREPKLRDAFLQVLFDHANMGGFHGEFTTARNMNNLRQALTDVARSVIGPTVTSVLITEITRQDA